MCFHFVSRCYSRRILQKTLKSVGFHDWFFKYFIFWCQILPWLLSFSIHSIPLSFLFIIHGNQRADCKSESEESFRLISVASQWLLFPIHLLVIVIHERFFPESQFRLHSLTESWEHPSNLHLQKSRSIAERSANLHFHYKESHSEVSWHHCSLPKCQIWRPVLRLIEIKTNPCWVWIKLPMMTDPQETILHPESNIRKMDFAVAQCQQSEPAQWRWLEMIYREPSQFILYSRIQMLIR